MLLPAKTLVLLVLTGSIISGCELVTEPGRGRVVGVLEWDRSTTSRSLELLAGRSTNTALPLPVISAPDTVTVGAPFGVVVRTIGFNSCWEPVSTELTRGDNAVTVVPYDQRMQSADLGCADGYKRIEHSAQITFSHPGEAVIRVRGRKIVGENFNQDGEPIEVEKRIHVQ